jgi:hypothetical protein
VTRPIRVYVIGPYSHPDPAVVQENVNRALDVAEQLEDLGYIAVAPHLFHYRDQRHPRSYAYWMERTRREQETCDVAVRLPGPSKGGDDEQAYAPTLGQPVFHSARELVAAMESAEPVGPVLAMDAVKGMTEAVEEMRSALDRSSGVLIPASWRGVTTQTKP